jgi:hypothetical protein
MDREFDRNDYVDLRYSKAHALAVDRGWTPRRMVPEGVYTAEYNYDRLNLATEGDIVVEASLG